MISSIISYLIFLIGTFNGFFLGFHLIGSIFGKDPVLSAYFFQNDHFSTQNEVYTSTFSDFQLEFSTFFGGSNFDSGRGIFVDTEKNFYFFGSTRSEDFPTKNAYNSTYSGRFDIFLSKFSPGGEELLFSTFIGGSGDEFAQSLFVDAFGYIYLSGYTSSSDFPTKNAYDTTFGGKNDVFLIKMSNDGKEILFSTFLGGSDFEFLRSFHIDANQHIYLTGETHSNDFPTKNAYDDTYNGGINASESGDTFLTKLSSDGKDLIFSTYIGGSNTDILIGQVLDDENNIYLSGTTQSPDFPTKNAFNGTYNNGSDLINGAGDGVIVKFSSNGQELLFSTYFGGSGYDHIGKVLIDNENNIIFTTFTGSPDLPTKNAFYPNFGGGVDIALTKMTADGQNLLFSTYFGGTGDDSVTMNTFDTFNNIILVGKTSSHDFPKIGDNNHSAGGKTDIFISKISGEGLVFYSKVIGGTETDEIFGTVIDNSDNVYIVGVTDSPDFPVRQAFQTQFKDGVRSIPNTIHATGDGFFMKYSLPNDSIVFSSFFGGSSEDYLFQIIIDDFSNVYIAGATKSVDFPTVNPYMNFTEDNDLLLMILTVDLDHDGMSNLWEEIHGLNPAINDAQEDPDHDGMPNLWEYQNHLIPNINDAQEDQDSDGMPNLWEYQMGLQANINDAQEDLDHDGMPNLWEYQNDLLANTSDSQSDKDGDWVTNINEFYTNTQANDFWSFPLLYPAFPFIISLPALFFVSIISLGVVGGVAGAISLNIYQQRLLMKQLGVNDYETALKMKKGGFLDFETYKKAQEQNIDSLEEYEFVNELQETTNKSEED
ncbi:MAG: hypothetical protein ACW981_21475 [Candidatus Hodarchaeales archaeon]